MPKKTKSKAASAKTQSEKIPKSRTLKLPKYKSFRPSKRIKHPAPKLIGAPRLFWRSILHIKKHWKIFLFITVVYLLLTVVFVRGFSSNSDLLKLKPTLQSVFQGQTRQLATGITLFGVLVGGNGGATTDVASAYQSILLLVVSLALIWTIRQTYNQAKPRWRDAFYKSMYPLVPFLLVLLVIGLQLLPLVIGNAVYGIVVGNGIAVTALEKVLWGSLFFGLALLSLYMVSSSLFALYIVTLADMTPMQALRSARELVRFRRWEVMRKVLFMPLALLVLAAVIMLPLILLLTGVADWIFLILSMVGLVIVHSYMYALYRELL